MNRQWEYDCDMNHLLNILVLQSNEMSKTETMHPDVIHTPTMFPLNLLKDISYKSATYFHRISSSALFS